ncbi:hypothetical protein ACTXT7_010240 [Hymenolepis weldensis]
MNVYFTKQAVGLADKLAEWIYEKLELKIFSITRCHSAGEGTGHWGKTIASIHSIEGFWSNGHEPSERIDMVIEIFEIIGGNSYKCDASEGILKLADENRCPVCLGHYQIFTQRCVTEHENLNMLGPNRIEEPELSNFS